MKIKGIFCTTTARTNEEYRIVLKKRNKLYLGLSLIGLLTIVLTLAAAAMEIPISDHTEGYYCGIGTGLLLGGVLVYFRNLRLMKDEQKLKEERLKNSDERLISISNKAFRTATVAMLVVAYLICLVGGIYSPILFKVLWMLIVFLLFAYIISYRYYNSKM